MAIAKEKEETALHQFADKWRTKANEENTQAIFFWDRHIVVAQSVVHPRVTSIAVASSLRLSVRNHHKVYSVILMSVFIFGNELGIHPATPPRAMQRVNRTKCFGERWQS